MVSSLMPDHWIRNKKRIDHEKVHDEDVDKEKEKR